LVRGVEMRSVVRGTDFCEHANDDSEESRQFRHRRNITSSGLRRWRANYLWSRPAKPVASIRDGVTDVLGPHVLVRADPNTYAIAAIATWLAASGRIGREGSRPMADFSSPRRTDQPAKRSTTWRVPLNSNGRWLAANVRVQPGLRDQSEAVDRAAHAKRAPIEHARVHHRRADVRVAQQLLDGPNVVPILEQVCSE